MLRTQGGARRERLLGSASIPGCPMVNIPTAALWSAPRPLHTPDSGPHRRADGIPVTFTPGELSAPLATKLKHKEAKPSSPRAHGTEPVLGDVGPPGRAQGPWEPPLLWGPLGAAPHPAPAGKEPARRSKASRARAHPAHGPAQGPDLRSPWHHC